jgi:3,4-dihydroxy 2-butanone 4-phosphate synthase / GTP cyclohydrolase II
LQQFQFDSIPDALHDLQSGRLVVVVDDENRENEGDLIGAAQFSTPEAINFMATHARGLICLAMTGDRLDQLDLPLMVNRNTDSNQTAFTVSIDAAIGTSTGISADDRSRTIQVAIHPATKPDDLRRPGHIFPLRSRSGGVLKRAGHTEAAVDLARLAGLYPAGVICEIQNDNGSMARLPELVEYAKKHNLKLISIADLISYRLEHERFVHRETIAKLPSQFGDFNIYAYRNNLDNTEHVAIVKGDPSQFPDQEVIVRVHSECLTGDALGSLRCDCRGQLQSALKMIEYAGAGVVVYLRQEGRGIGLINKLKAYALQDLGLDTVEANERLGFGPDLRTYGVGGQILYDLGVRKMRLITNNPRKIAGLKGFGIEVVGRLPLLIETNEYNLRYLETKAEKLGHLLLQTKLITLFVRWAIAPNSVPNADYQDHLRDKLRSLVNNVDLLMQEEVSLAVAARFGGTYHSSSSIANLTAPQFTIVHLGFDQANMLLGDWYAMAEHPYHRAIAQILNALTQLEEVSEFKFFVPSPQSDPEASTQTINPSHDQVFDPQMEWQPGIVYHYKQM